MRNKGFIAEHCGGSLKKKQHYQLALWSRKCVRHVLHLYGKRINKDLEYALRITKEWTNGNASAGDARKASVKCLVLARKTSDPVARAVVRATGHAVATAHMADHSVGGALYALKAIYKAGLSIEVERKWQIKQLPKEIKKLVLAELAEKENHFKFS